MVRQIHSNLYSISLEQMVGVFTHCRSVPFIPGTTALGIGPPVDQMVPTKHKTSRTNKTHRYYI